MPKKMFDVANICRICLSEEYPKLPIFTEDDEKSESKPTLPEKIMSFAQVKVVKDDGLPMYICVKCYCQVDTTVEFKRLCEESFHYFKRQLGIFSNMRAPSLQDDKENFDDQHHILPEDCIKGEEYEPQYEMEEEPSNQEFGITDESWLKNDADFDASIIKCETSLDYPNIEFDLSNVKIENFNGNWSDEEHLNPLEINLEDSEDAEAPICGGLISTSNIDKTCKCRSCEMVFANRREMGFHISFAHRRCSICAKYFYSNKDKEEHVCNQVTETRTDYVDQYCHICNTKVEQINSHMSWHHNNTVKAAFTKKETSMENESFVIPMQINPENELFEDNIKCSLCDVVCLNEKGFKVHLKCMHADHRITYPCYICKSRNFFSKMSCIKHLNKKHGIEASENIKFELMHMDSDTSTKIGQQKKFKTIYCKSEKKFNLKTECLEPVKYNNNSSEKSSERSKSKKKKTDVSPRKSLKQSHPPFSHTSPIIRNNFNVTLDHKGVKRYVCRGCDVVYKGYVAAYNHYYAYRKRKATAEEDDELVMDAKPYSCKFCKLKFASGSQAMMHRIHAHKYFYKKCAIEKK